MKWTVLLLCALLLTGCHRSSNRIEQALHRAVNYLAARQSKDGAWRSDMIAPFKDGPTLTPVILQALSRLPGPPPAAATRARKYLLGLPASALKKLPFPVYSCAAAAYVLHGPKRAPWLARVEAFQMTEQLGWGPNDPEYGGWGEIRQPPRKPAKGRNPSASPNISATLFALESLRQAGIKPDDPRIQKALRFVKSCQNKDGGFIYAPTYPSMNKAGKASYGSATADGLRALVACGLSEDSPRVKAAHHWLVKNFRADVTAGPFNQSNRRAAQAIYYYYCASMGQVLTIFPNRAWARALSQQLLKRQKPDGSWINPVKGMTEGDPLVATQFAITALAGCEQALGGTRGPTSQATTSP